MTTEGSVHFLSAPESVNKSGATHDWIKSVVWRTTLTWTIFRIKRRVGFRQPAELKIKPRQVRYPVAIRLGGSSDLSVFFQIVVFEEYACMRDVPSPSSIVDLGANVGYASAYFPSCFRMPGHGTGTGS
jgi:hypothetical protein